MSVDKVRVESIFEENICTTCGRFGVDQYSSIVDNFIKYKNELVSFAEIIRVTLDFQPTPENCSMEICEQCKLKLQEFYNFKIRSIHAQKIQSEYFSNQFLEKLIQLDNEICDPLIYSTVQIVRSYIKSHSVKSIQVDENSGNFLLISPSTSPNTQENESQSDKVTVLSKDEGEETILEELEEAEYLEELLDETLECEEEDETLFLIDNDSTQDSAKSTNNVRRPRHEDEWKCNKRKKLRNSGQSYINTKGNLVEGRKMLSSCGSCRNRCTERLTEEDREMNFNRFWKLGNVVEQRKFIYKHIVTKKPTRRKAPDSNRSVTLEFYLDKSDAEGTLSLVHVCKKMFKNTLAVSNQVIQGVVRKYANSNFVDSRGKHERKLTAAQELAKDHVQRFPFFYVEQNMTKVQLYNMYVEECKAKNVTPVKESNYREIFDKFNSNSFLKTEKVLCEKCNRFYKATDEERLALQKEHNDHIAADKKCRDRALGRIRHRRSIERRKAEKLERMQATE